MTAKKDATMKMAKIDQLRAIHHFLEADVRNATKLLTEVTHQLRAALGNDDEPEASELVEVLKDNLSPEAVAAIAISMARDSAELFPLAAEAPEPFRQAAWFREQLIQMVGGEKHFRRICADEVGARIVDE